MKQKLRNQYAFSILMLIFLVVAILSTTLLIQFKSSVRKITHTVSDQITHDSMKNLRKRGTDVANLLARDLLEPLARYDMGHISKILQFARQQHNITYVYLFDSNGRVVHDGLPNIPDLGRAFESKTGRNAVAAEKLITQSESDVIDVARPIRTAAGEKIGGIRLGFSLGPIAREIQNTQLQLDTVINNSTRMNMILIFVLILLFSPFGFMLAFILARNLTQPITALSNYATQIGRGDYDIEPMVKRTDEIGELASSFQTMVNQLKTTTVSKKYVDDIIGQIIDLLVVVSPDGVIKTVNRATCEILEYKTGELEGMPFENIIDDEAFKQSWMEDIREKGILSGVETRFLSKDKRAIAVQFSGSVMRTPEGGIKAIVCVAQDVTQLKKNQKFAAIGQLASSVAHELRNPLGAIKNSIYYFKEVLKGSNIMKEDPSLSDFLALSDKEIKRSNRIVSELLDYSREVKLNLQSTHINELIDEITAVVEIPDNISWVKNQEDDIPPAMIDTQKFQQVFINIANNAIQAMPQGGKIIIDTILSDAAQHAGQDITIKFSDTGIGMNEDTQRHIFEPLYTTRNSGTGLGLAICHEIIHAHGGTIAVESKPSQGTTFIIVLPLVTPKDPSSA